MLSYHLGTVNDFHWEFEPVSSYNKPHTFNVCPANLKKNNFTKSIKVLQWLQNITYWCCLSNIKRKCKYY